MTEGKTLEQNTLRTQSRAGVPSQLERIREAARRQKELGFTALLHHVYDVERLRQAYFALKREAAAGIDGETWKHYGEQLGKNLEDLATLTEGGKSPAVDRRRPSTDSAISVAIERCSAAVNAGESVTWLEAEDGMRRLVVLMALACAAWLWGTRAEAACGGDCDGDLEIAATEIATGVDIALGRRPPGDCPAADIDGGGVVVSDLVGAAVSYVEGCPGAPTRTRTSPPSATSTPTPTPTQTAPVVSPTATPTAGGTVAPGCDNGSWTVTYANVSATNAVTTSVDLGRVTGTEGFDSRSGRYSWLLTGLECAEGVRFGRIVNLQAVLQTSGLVPGTYPLTPPFANITYQEMQDPLVFIRTWANTSGSLTVDERDGDRVRFRMSVNMVPSTILSLNSVPVGTFTLEISGTVEKLALL